VRIAEEYYAKCPEPLVVSLARSGDRGAYADLVRRRQASVRSLMRRCAGDATLADDLAQQVFFQVWLRIGTLKQAEAFGGWLKRLAISIWLQHQRKHDALHGADELGGDEGPSRETTGIGMDLDRALDTLPDVVRLCIVLSYQEGMTHAEIADVTELPLGTVKSHINRGTQKLQQLLSAYRDESAEENS